MENFLSFDFGDGTKAIFGFEASTDAQSLAALIASTVGMRLRLRNVQGIGKKSRAWSGRRFTLSAQIQGKDCTASLAGPDYSAMHTDFEALASAAIDCAREYANRVDVCGLHYVPAPVREKVTAELN